MRDILNDLEAGRLLSDPDPIRRAQIQMRTPLPKRFYKEVTVAAGEGGFVVHLDGKPVKTPGKALLVLPTERAARLVADEFAAQGETLDLGFHAGLSPRQHCDRRRRQRPAGGAGGHTALLLVGPALLPGRRTRHAGAPPERGLGPDHRLGAGDARRPAPARRGRHPCRAAARGDRRDRRPSRPARRAAPPCSTACDDQPDGLGAAWRWPSISANSTPKLPGTPPMSTRTSRPSTGARTSEALARRAHRKRDMIAAAELIEAIRT